MTDTASVIQSSMTQAATSVITSQSQIGGALAQIQAAQVNLGTASKATGSGLSSFGSVRTDRRGRPSCQGTFVAANWDGLVVTFKALLKIAAGIASAFAFAASSVLAIVEAGHNISTAGERDNSKSKADGQQDFEQDELSKKWNKNLVAEEEYFTQRDALKVKYQDIYNQIEAAHPLYDALADYKKNVKAGDDAFQKTSVLIDGVGKNRRKALADGDLDARATNPGEYDFNPSAQNEAPNVATHGINTVG